MENQQDFTPFARDFQIKTKGDVIIFNFYRNLFIAYRFSKI